MSGAALPIADTSEIVFSEGIIGVPRARRFQLLEKPGSQIRMLRCLDIEGFVLPVTDPRLADPRYAPQVDERIRAMLGLRDDEPVLLLAITTLVDQGPALANLKAPLVISVERRTGTQIILDDPGYSLRTPVEESR